jgi:hypothetical protein
MGQCGAILGAGVGGAGDAAGAADIAASYRVPKGYIADVKNKLMDE